jgi:hypothetical protein
MTEVILASAPNDTVIAPFRVGVIPVPFDGLNRPALKYLILHLNTIQSVFEFEFLPVTSDDFLQRLRTGVPVERAELRNAMPEFAARYVKFLEGEAQLYGLETQIPDHLTVVCAATFRDHFYSSQRAGVGVIALGDWSKEMAPPSFLEFVYTLLLRSAVGAAFLKDKPSHYPTRGCLMDFTADLDDVRFKVLNANICASCADLLTKASSGDSVRQLRYVLAKTWIGNPLMRGTPAAVIAKLGYDLFLTSGMKPTTWEKAKAKLEEEWVKQVVELVGKLLLAAALVWFGWKSAG